MAAHGAGAAGCNAGDRVPTLIEAKVPQVTIPEVYFRVFYPFHLSVFGSTSLP
jgi:hypothetical protein